MMGASAAPIMGGGGDGGAARAQLEKLLPKEEAELLRLGEEAKALSNELVELRFKHCKAEDTAATLENELVVLDAQIERLASDRAYLEAHGSLPPPSFVGGAGGPAPA